MTSVTTLAVLAVSLVAGPCVDAICACRGKRGHGDSGDGGAAPDATAQRRAPAGSKPARDAVPDVPAWLVAPALVFTAATVVLAIGSAFLVIIKRTGPGGVQGCAYGTYIAMVSTGAPL